MFGTQSRLFTRGYFLQQLGSMSTGSGTHLSSSHSEREEGRAVAHCPAGAAGLASEQDCLACPSGTAQTALRECGVQEELGDSGSKLLIGI